MELHFGVSGIVLKEDEVLLVRHTYGPAKGKLLIPGGHVEDGELFNEAIIREISEETEIIFVSFFIFCFLIFFIISIKNYLNIRIQNYFL